ncbi:MAG: hypothetical protein HQL74_07485 [Magnetococcales bacterium]|nr:hypothetical protein [Magnetococcales bacterium]
MKNGIDVTRIKGIRMVCRKCHSEWMIPLDSTNIPQKCFNCFSIVPSEPIRDALQGLARLKSAAASNHKDFQFDAVIDKYPAV